MIIVNVGPNTPEQNEEFRQLYADYLQLGQKAVKLLRSGANFNIFQIKKKGAVVPAADYHRLTNADIVSINHAVSRFLGGSAASNDNQNPLSEFTLRAIKEAPTMTQKAAQLWYALSSSQPFGEANDATALLTSLLFLRINGYDFSRLKPAELVTMAQNLALGQAGQNEAQHYLFFRLKLTERERPKSVKAAFSELAANESIYGALQLLG